jgi:PKD repeat protein
VGAVPLTVSFRSLPSGGTGTYDFTWDFGDGATSHQRHPAHTYTRPGVFGASLAVTSGDQVRACERSITTSGEAVNPAPPGKPGPPLPDLVITITGLHGASSFSPNPASARVGQKVVWLNSDALPHTATANGGAFDTGIVDAGASSAAVAMGAAGTFPYRCTLHPSMTGTLVVTP